MGRAKRQVVVFGVGYCAVLTDQDDYTKTRNYWKYLKAKLKKENSEVVSATT